MNPTSNQLPLRDIHLPDPVSWWPPAPGWWLLLLTLLILVLLTPLLLKILRQKSLRKLALTELQKIQHRYTTQQDKQQLVQDISILLRRTCMSYISRRQAASLTGDAWINQLNQLTGEVKFDTHMAQLLLTAPYRKHNELDAEALLLHCQRWLQALPRRYAP